MKKVFIISLAALVAMCACTKNEALEGVKQEVTFSVGTVTGQTKADTDAPKDPADYADEYAKIPFGTYAWFYGEESGAKAQTFMNDETVSLQGSEWKPSTTYYWPKSGSIDFISYSPKTISKFVKVTENSINIGEKDKEYIVEHMTDVDVMYADKAVGQTKNVTPATYYYTGVPTLFRHALAKVNVNVKTAYDEKVMKEGEDETSWVITVTDFTIENYYNEGTLGLTLDDKNAWPLPKPAVWTPAGELVDSQSFADQFPKDKEGKPALPVNAEKAEPVMKDYFVLPQTLDKGQTIVVTVDIVTTLPNGNVIIEKGVELTAPMSSQALTAWEMNKQISYDLTIFPAAKGNDDNPIAILFDPAVKDWDAPVSASTEI